MLHSRVRGTWGQVEGKAGARHATENTRKRACETSAVQNPGLTRSSQPRVCSRFANARNLESEAEAELTPKCVGDDGARRIDEALWMAEVRGIGNVGGATDTKVVAVVGAVCQIERLREQLQVHAIAELDVFRQAHIELEERLAAQRIVFCDGQG